MASVTVEQSKTPLTAFKVLSFDVYGTLIDWESGIYNAVVESAPFASLPADSPQRDRKTVLEQYEHHERKIEHANPGMEYATLLAEVYKGIVTSLAPSTVPSSEEVSASAETFSKSIKDWPAFPDTLAALRTLQKHYKLVPLSNSSPSTFGASLAGPFKGFSFDAVYLAAQIGSYKPDRRNFEYLIEHVKADFGVDKDQILHVAQSLHHDHLPATEFGLARCWVDRSGVMGVPVGKVSVHWEVKALGELADLVEKAFAEDKA